MSRLSLILEIIEIISEFGGISTEELVAKDLFRELDGEEDAERKDKEDEDDEDDDDDDEQEKDDDDDEDDE